MTCEDVRLALGAHALGALEPDEALEIDTHLATCEVCGAELLDLEGVASFLGKVSERDVELVSSPPRAVLDRLLNARAKRHRRGRALLAVAASVAVMAVGGTVWTASQQSRPAEESAAAPASSQDSADLSRDVSPYMEPDAPQDSAKLKSAPTPSPAATTRASPKVTAPGREFPAENEARGYYANVAAWSGGPMTQLSVRVVGVPIGTTCRLVVYGRRGERDTTPAWKVSPETYKDRAVFPRQTWIPMNRITRFEVVDSHSRVLVKVPVPKRK
jgi:anti-sigma factor RsiW